MKNPRIDPEISSLQNILTRLSDSVSGLLLAADFSSDPALVRLCERAAEAREGLMEELAAVIAHCGAPPSLEGSHEAGVHRAWIRFVCHLHPKQRTRLRAECARGERELRRTILDARNEVTRSERTAAVIKSLLAEVEATLSMLKPEHSSASTPAALPSAA